MTRERLDNYPVLSTGPKPESSGKCLCFAQENALLRTVQAWTIKSLLIKGCFNGRNLFSVVLITGRKYSCVDCLDIIQQRGIVFSESALGA